VNPNLPVGGSALEFDVGTSGGLPEDRTSVALTTSFTAFRNEREGTTIIDRTGQPTVDFWLSALSLRHHFGEGWSAEALVPAGLVELTTDPSAPSQRLAGFGDITFGGRYDLAAWWGAGGYRPSLSVGLLFGLPTGEQAVLASDPTVPPNLLGIGSGAFSATGEVVLTQFLHKNVAIAIPLSSRAPLSRNELGRKTGASVRLGVAGIFLPRDWLTVRVGVQGENIGHVDEEEEGIVVNSGGDWLRAEALLAFRPAKNVMLGLSGRLPVWADVNGRQIAETWSTALTLSVAFGGKEDEHDHGDEHGDEHGGHDDHGDEHGGHDDHGDEHGGHDDHGDERDGHDDHGDEHGGHDDHGDGHVAHAADIRDVATGGASFDLAAVLAPGKITVVDYWAEWCHPCKHVDTALRQLAAKHADLAVRRAEAPDADAPIARAHLDGSVRLPQVWIFDRHGKLIEKLAPTTEAAVRRRVAAALRAQRGGNP